MPVTAPVDISRVLAARADLAVVEGPASDNKRSAVTNVSLNKILVGKVTVWVISSVYTAGSA